MDSISKCFSLLLVLVLVFSSLIMAKPAFAQTPVPTPSGIPTPSVPTFTVQNIVYTSYVAPTYTINPYTGQNETTSSGGQVDNQTLEFTITNQPFIPYNDANGNYIGLYYNFRYKGHYGDTWSYYPFTLPPNTNQSLTEQTTHSYGGLGGGGQFIFYSASNSANTIISIPLDLLTPFPGGPQIPDGSQVDFEVQAQIGQISPIPSGMLAGDFYNFTGQLSDWSNTQTLTINYNSNSTALATSPNPTLSPATTSNSMLTPKPTPTSTSVSSPSYASLLLITTIALVVIAFLLVVIIFLLLYRRHPKIASLGK